MKVYEKKEVKVVNEILVNTVCDICKKDIDIKKQCYEVTTGHNDLGNDSCESVEYHDVCSDECLKKEFDLYLNSKYHTKYINIERG